MVVVLGHQADKRISLTSVEICAISNDLWKQATQLSRDDPLGVLPDPLSREKGPGEVELDCLCMVPEVKGTMLVLAKLVLQSPTPQPVVLGLA